MSGLTLIASYPKSGNTWMRAFLASVNRGGEAPDINTDLSDVTQLSARGKVDAAIEEDSSDLTIEEVARIRAHVSRHFAALGEAALKVHDANLASPHAEEPAYPVDVIERVVYIVRDPRDVAVSNTHHFGKTIEDVVTRMADPDYGIGQAQKRLNTQVHQYVSSWSRHVESWLDDTRLNRHLVHYEDMLTDPMTTFTGVVRFLGLHVDDAVIAKAISATAFDQLAQQEARSGFRERLTQSDAPFFRQGRIGGWRERLSPELATRIETDHRAVMQRLGYLD
ncbi:sulfotransferase domain-containing protein [Brevundimonas sp.]|uniref:sulfotransferase domain-containing protein n=1 Tax=Brevundimonas sp. TaxID=1871086 RepID=UPI002ABCD5D5|nr:sulfotransferase domain-containing protein [Brevundimonas sp.]MDZ4363855.1 sulfotransferase domain-containing protein [Brevundimonas sp.]